MTDQPTPTPRTDAQLLCMGDWGYSEVVDAAFARGLERELGNPTDAPDANTTAHARINWWKDRCDDLNEQLANLREGFDAEGRTAAEACCVAFKTEQVERIGELERELAAAREQWRMSSVCRELRAELDRERALADRLAEVLRLYDADTLAGETMQWVPEHDKALAAWKEARRE